MNLNWPSSSVSCIELSCAATSAQFNDRSAHGPLFEPAINDVASNLSQ